MRRTLATVMISGAILTAGAGWAADPLISWDGLQLVHSEKFDQVFLRPGADFHGYTKVILETPEVAFAKNWQKDYNSSVLYAQSRVSDLQVQEAITEGVKAAADIFTQAWTKGGYAPVQTPGPDVMKVKTGVLNIVVTTPQTASSGQTLSFAREAGRATFFIEVRDSLSGTLLARAVDRELIGNDLNSLRTKVSNRADFRSQVEIWANLSVRAMNTIKEGKNVQK